MRTAKDWLLQLTTMFQRSYYGLKLLLKISTLSHSRKWLLILLFFFNCSFILFFFFGVAVHLSFVRVLFGGYENFFSPVSLCSSPSSSLNTMVQEGWRSVSSRSRKIMIMTMHYEDEQVSTLLLCVCHLIARPRQREREKYLKFLNYCKFTLLFFLLLLLLSILSQQERIRCS